MIPAAVGQLGIDLVGKDKDILLDADLRDLLEIVTLHDRARGIVRERQNEHFRFVGDRRAQVVRSETEVILVFGVDDDRYAACHYGQRLVADERGLGNDDLVPSFHQRAEREVDRLAAAHGDERLRLRLICNAEAPFVVFRDFLQQVGKAAVGRVPCSALLQTADALVADMPRRLEIRLADTQRDHVLHLIRDIKELADSRRVYRLYAAVEIF